MIARDPASLLAGIPYCAHLGIAADVTDDTLTLVMPYAQMLVGNTMLPALHGGVIGSLLETAALAQILWETGAAKMPRPVDIAIDYLRTGRALRSFARARIAKHGRRVLNVHAEMWQDDPAMPVASLRGHFLV
ncbi:MAG: PaaI family thioesterase [Rhizomicrobium sp.]